MSRESEVQAMYGALSKLNEVYGITSIRDDQRKPAGDTGRHVEPKRLKHYFGDDNLCVDYYMEVEMPWGCPGKVAAQDKKEALDLNRCNPHSSEYAAAADELWRKAERKALDKLCDTLDIISAGHSLQQDGVTCSTCGIDTVTFGERRDRGITLKCHGKPPERGKGYLTNEQYKELYGFTPHGHSPFCDVRPAPGICCGCDGNEYLSINDAMQKRLRDRHEGLERYYAMIKAHSREEPSAHDLHEPIDGRNLSRALSIPDPCEGSLHDRVMPYRGYDGQKGA